MGGNDEKVNETLLIHLFHTQNSRNKMLLHNILFSGVLKGIGLLSSLLIVPVTINYLNNEVYGIWMTITSILYWITAFDIGLGNGMRNYLTERISMGDYAGSRKYIATTFMLLAVIAAALFLLTLFPLFTLNFNWVFNTTSVDNTALRDALLIAIFFTLLNFVLKNIGFVFVALQKYALNDLLNVSGNVISLIITFILTQCTQGNLLYVVVVYTSTYTVIYSAAFVPIFKRYPQLRPALSDFEKGIGQKIVKKGLGFFIIQITSCLVIFGAANLFITQYCGPEEVTVYNIAYKYFNLLVIGYTIILSPMWNAYTDAYVKGDMHWIRRNFNRSLLFWGASVAMGGLMLILCQAFYRLWVGHQVSIPFSVSLSVLLYVCMFNLNNCVTFLINGLNKIRVQIITSLVFTALYIILVINIGPRLGTEGISLSMAFCYALMSMIHLYQCRLLIHQKAKGIWNR